MQEELYGFVDQILFSSDQFTVAKLKEPRKTTPTWIIGMMPTLQVGESVRCRGTWKHHPEHGKQFEVTDFESKRPSDLIGIQKYLESGLIKGIGPTYAERIVAAFGEKTLDVIDSSPERLLEISGIGKKRAARIEVCWQEQKSIREVMLFLKRYGISPAYAQKIFRAFGEKSIEKISSDPFSLAKEIRGIGFKTADSIAQGLGIPPYADVRIDAAIEHSLWELSNEGNTYYPQDRLIEVVSLLISIEKEKIGARILALVERKELELSDEGVALPILHWMEEGIARDCARLLSHPKALRKVDCEKAISWVQEKLQIELAEEQKLGVIGAISSPIHIITGGPGTGKSTITKAILAITEKLSPDIVLAAPTGRAAKRMTQITKRAASTLHVLLEWEGGSFKRNRENPLSCNLLIVDEASMIDTNLLYALLRAIPSSTRLILIGDIDQLPSIGPGNVLRDLIASSCIPLTTLTQIFRQARNSKIVTTAHAVNQGQLPDFSYEKGSNLIFFREDDPEKICAKIAELITSTLPQKYHFNPLSGVQVLSPMKKGTIGTENLNFLLQQKLNPSQTPLSRMGKTFHVGDKVIQLQNNYQKMIFNGDIGILTSIDWVDQSFTVSFEEKRVSYDFREMDDLALAYAVSVHKYQGSESPCVVIPIHPSHFKLLHRNLLYTAITRGKSLVVLIGSIQAIAMAVQNNEVKKRYTNLAKKLKSSIELNDLSTL